MNTQPELIWEPTQESVRAENCNLTAFKGFVEARHEGLVIGPPNPTSYVSFVNWSSKPETREDYLVDCWDFFGVIGKRGGSVIEEIDGPPGKRFFSGSKVNYTENALDYWIKHPDEVAIIYRHQDSESVIWTGRKLCAEVSKWQKALEAEGIQKGECIAINMNYTPDFVALMLAAGNIGAPTIMAGTELSLNAIAKRFRQAKPKMLVSIDGYKIKDKTNPYVFSKDVHVLEVARAEAKEKKTGKPQKPLKQDEVLCVENLQRELPTVQNTLVLPYFDGKSAKIEGLKAAKDARSFVDSFTALKPEELVFNEHDFDDILYYLFTSGTTGKPKGLEHSHGRMVMRHLGEHVLNWNLGPGKKYFQSTYISWMMCPYHVSALLSGTTMMMYDGYYMYPDPAAQLRFAADHKCTHFVSSAGQLRSGLIDDNIDIKKLGLDLSSIEVVGYTGGAMNDLGFIYLRDHIFGALPIISFSGGTDGVFAGVGGNPWSPVFAGYIQGPMMGTTVECWDENKKPTAPGEKGEVMYNFFISMPVGMLEDPDGQRYMDAYFDEDWNWNHKDKSAVFEIPYTDWKGVEHVVRQTIFYGRSGIDHNKNNLKSEPYEIYAEMDKAGLGDKIRQKVSLNFMVGDENMIVMLVALPDGANAAPEDLQDEIVSAISRTIGSHGAPDYILALDGLPQTANGKDLEKLLNPVLEGEMPDDPSLYVRIDHTGQEHSAIDAISFLRDWAEDERAHLEAEKAAKLNGGGNPELAAG